MASTPSSTSTMEQQTQVSTRSGRIPKRSTTDLALHSALNKKVKCFTRLERYYWRYLEFIWKPRSAAAFQEAIERINSCSDEHRRELLALPPGLIMAAAIQGGLSLEDRRLSRRFLYAPKASRKTYCLSLKVPQKDLICGTPHCTDLSTGDNKFGFCPLALLHIQPPHDSSDYEAITHCARDYGSNLPAADDAHSASHLPGRDCEILDDDIRCHICLQNLVTTQATHVLEEASIIQLMKDQDVGLVRPSTKPLIAGDEPRFVNRSIFSSVTKLAGARALLIKVIGETRHEQDCSEPMRLSCGHVFGLKCIKRWLNDNNTCPMCRRDTREKVPPTTLNSTISFTNISPRAEGDQDILLGVDAGYEADGESRVDDDENATSNIIRILPEGSAEIYVRLTSSVIWHFLRGVNSQASQGNL